MLKRKFLLKNVVKILQKCPNLLQFSLVIFSKNSKNFKFGQKRHKNFKFGQKCLKILNLAENAKNFKKNLNFFKNFFSKSSYQSKYTFLVDVEAKHLKNLQLNKSDFLETNIRHNIYCI